MTTANPASSTHPRWLGAYAEQVVGARGDRNMLTRVVERSSIPMVLVDGQRRPVEGNGPARLAVRLSLDELRRLRIEDLTPPHLTSLLEEQWRRLLDTGCVAGQYEIATPDESYLNVTYYALASALPGLHLIAFVPAQWPEDELLESDIRESPAVPALSARESQVLARAADGLSGPMIARDLGVSAATVRTHFEHIYSKLGVRDRAAAVAKGMRLGRIA
jgi:DNA-binding NarL/FixJ family response regulator